MAEQSPESRRAPVRTHRAARWVAFIGASLLVVVVIALIALQSTPARQFALQRATALLAQQGITLSAKGFTYNLLALSTDLRDVRIMSPQMPDGPPFMEIDHVRIDLSTWQVLRGKYVVDAGSATGVRVHYFVGANGVDNLPRPVTDPDEQSKPIQYLIRDLKVPDAAVRYENRAQGIDLAIPRATLTMTGNAVTNRHAVSIDAPGGDLRAGDRAAHLDRVGAVLDLGRDDVKVERAELQAEGAVVNASGTVGPFASPVVDVNVQARLDAARAVDVARIDEKLSGAVSVEASVKGPVDALTVDAHLSGADMQVRDLSGLDADASVAYTIGEDTVRVSRLHVTGPIGTLDGRGEVSRTAAHQSRIDATLDGLQAEPLMRALAAPYRIATRIDGRVNAEWPGLVFEKANGQATLLLTPTATVPSRSIVPVGGRLRLDGDGSKVAVTAQNVRAASATIDGNVTLRAGRRLDGALHLTASDLQATQTAIEAVLGRVRGSLVPAPIGGSLAADSHIGGELSAPVVTATIQAPALAVAQLRGIALTGDIAYRTDAVTVDRVDLIWQGAQAHASGRIALTGRQALDVAIQADRLPIGGLLSAFEQDGLPLSGVISAQTRVGGTVTNPSAGIHLEVTDLVAYNELLGSLVADGRYASQQLDVTSFLLDKPQTAGNGQLAGTASYQLGSGRYSVDARSHDLRLQTLQLPSGEHVSGSIDLVARGTGTVTDPAGTVTIRANDLVVDAYQIGGLTTDTTLTNGQAVTVMTAPRLSLVAKSTVATGSPYLATVSATVDDLALAALPVTLQTPLEGKLGAQFDGSGPLSEPRRSRAELVVNTFSGAWNQKPFALDGPAHLRYADERLTIDRLRLTAEDSTIAVEGNLPLLDRAAPGAITIDANANLATLAQYAPVGTTLAADGRVTLTGSLKGTLASVDPTLKLAVVDALIFSTTLQPGISNLNASATIADGQATIDRLAANWGSARIAMSASVPLDVLPELPVEIPRRGGLATIHATLDGFDPGTIPGAPAGLSGKVSFDADVSARRAALQDAEGRVAFRELQLAFNGLTLEQKSASAVAVSNGVASIEQLSLGGTVGTLSAAGTVGLAGDMPINLDLNGGLNIAALSLVTDRVRAEGKSVLDIAARGTAAAPVLTGHIAIDDGTIAIDEPRIAAEALSARIELDQNRVTLSSLSAGVNGGTLIGKGSLAIADGDLRDVNIELSTRDFAFDAPLDLRSLSDANLKITSQADDILVAGQVTIQEAGLTGDINFDTGLLATISARRQLELTPERNPLLERVLFNIDVDTASPVMVDNNLAKAEVTTDLRVVGTPYETGLLGRLQVQEGGLVTLNERTFEIERGSITFIEDRRIYPSFDLAMNTTANNYDIRMTVTGEPGQTETTLTSNPALPEPDIMSMIVTGRTLEQMRGEEYDVAREQVLSYLTGRVGSSLGRQIRGATGLSEVRIEPELIANEANPGARLTLGQDVTDDLTLTYSVQLANSDDQIWVATYDVTRHFQTRAVRQSDNSYRVDFRHDIRKGGRPEPRREARVRPRVAAIAVPDDAPIAADQLRKMLGVEVGKEFDYFAVRNGTEDIEKRLREDGWLQSRVRLTRTTEDDGVHLSLRIVRGPTVAVSYSGTTPPGKVQEKVRQQWHRGVFDAQRTDDTVDTLRQWLMRDDFLQAKVDARVDDSDPDHRRVTFAVTPGPKSQRVLLEFQGASGIAGHELHEVIKEQKLERQLFTDPIVVTELLQRLYREQGYLNAKIDKPRVEFQGDVARVILAITEGPQFTVQDVRVRGNSAIASSELLVDLPVVAGDPFLPAAAENALQHIRDLYWAKGYNDVRPQYQLTIDRIGGHATVDVAINEGRQAIVTGVRVAGNDKTSDRLVREELTIKPAEPLNLQALSRSRKNLYDSGAFAIVDLSRDTVVDSAATPPADGLVGAIVGPTQKPVAVEIDVREVQPYQFRYGASYDTEGKLGGVVDASLHNLLGKARVVGVAGRYDAQLHEGRVYLSQPSLLYWPVQTTAAAYYREERNPATSVSQAFNVDRKGASIEQQKKLKNQYVWTYGYRFEQARTFYPLLDGRPDEFTKVSPLTTAFVRDTRDEVLDATRGSFSSNAFSFSPSWLGSDDTYMKYLGQHFRYFPLQREQRKRFSNEIIRPRFVFATAARVGWSKGMGAFVPSTERFLAGGSTTIRGFEQNAVGPIGPAGVPLGGDSMLILNNELRAPLFSLIDGVGFVDIGNVWLKGTGFSFGDLRETAGLGLRLRTKWVLIRTDYGFILDRRPNERQGRFYFSIGQAF